MRKTLIKLNQETSIDGSMVITPDGIMVAAALCSDLEEDAVAAFASSILLSMNRGLTMLNKRKSALTSCSLRGSGRTVTFYNMDNSFLVVVSNPSVNLDACVDSIQRAIHEIKHRRVA